jgi:DNA-nicking Smr family endonuclease
MDDDLLSDDDLMVWQYVTQSVEPLPERHLPPKLETKQAAPTPQKIPNIEDLLHKNTPPPPSKTKLEYIQHGENVGVDKATAKRLTGGKFTIEAKLDLHGKTQDAAFEALRLFIQSNYNNNRRNLLIITGKGPSNDGVLKNQVPRWLNTAGIREHTLMFSYAQPKHGGDGALYVLLKKKRAE